MYCHEALHLKEKLQTASYNQEVVAWDTDKDSDEEDVEADLAAFSGRAAAGWLPPYCTAGG